MIMGIPKEIMSEENRVAALPETVEKYKKLGFDVIVETRAGSGAFTMMKLTKKPVRKSQRTQ